MESKKHNHPTLVEKPGVKRSFSCRCVAAAPILNYPKDIVPNKRIPLSAVKA